jgi:hypothetical protein
MPKWMSRLCQKRVALHMQPGQNKKVRTSTVRGIRLQAAKRLADSGKGIRLEAYLAQCETAEKQHCN